MSRGIRESGGWCGGRSRYRRRCTAVLPSGRAALGVSTGLNAEENAFPLSQFKVKRADTLIIGEKL